MGAYYKPCYRKAVTKTPQPELDMNPEIPTPVGVPIKNCSLASAIDQVGDNWTLLILREVLCGSTRFDAIQSELGISRAVLANRLSLLVERDILFRHPHREPGRRQHHVYLMSKKGRALLPALIALRVWSEQFLPVEQSPLRLCTSSGEEVELRLTTTKGRIVDPGDIVAKTKPVPASRRRRKKR